VNLHRKTKRLIVRPLTHKDFLTWRDGYLNRLPSQNTFDPGPRPQEKTTREVFSKTLKASKKLRASDLIYFFGIFHRETGEMVGGIDLLVIQRLQFQYANLGYEIHNQHWGQGYAVEGARAALEIAFRDLHLHRVEALMEKNHKASRKVASRLGMKREGVRRGYFFTGKSWMDADVYAITAEDFGIKNYTPTIRSQVKDLLR
jgi:[ribosomal protein S5]-alanine N-acetyltransferase